MESAPTGCFKCGRPGHWSRDCPSSAPVPGNFSSSSTPAPSQNPNNENQRSSSAYNGNRSSMAPAPKATKTKVKRPKLTPTLLLSEEGLGYVLQYFPKSFKYHGRGKEVSDLGNLIGLYSEWHSRLLPNYTFDQYVHKVQKIASSKRVKISINSLRERVAHGVDPNKLYDKHEEENTAPFDDHGVDEPSHDQENIPTKSDDVDADSHTNADDFQDSMLDEIFDNAMDKSKLPSDERSESLTEEQKARMEANKLKAMERAQSISEEQRMRMEANRLKALERAKARLQPNQD